MARSFGPRCQLFRNPLPDGGFWTECSPKGSSTKGDSEERVCVCVCASVHVCVSQIIGEPACACDWGPVLCGYVCQGLGTCVCARIRVLCVCACVRLGTCALRMSGNLCTCQGTCAVCVCEGTCVCVCVRDWGPVLCVCQETCVCV